MNRYNREWLDGIDYTWKLIKDTPLDQVPFPHRPVIKQQFDCRVAEFKHALSNGLKTFEIQVDIRDLASLAIELIEETEKRRAAYASGATVFE